MHLRLLKLEREPSLGSETQKRQVLSVSPPRLAPKFDPLGMLKVRYPAGTGLVPPSKRPNVRPRCTVHVKVVLKKARHAVRRAALKARPAYPLSRRVVPARLGMALPDKQN